MWLALLCLALVGCGPVILGEEPSASIGGAGGGSSDAAIDPPQMPGSSGSSGSGAELPRPNVVVHLLPIDCGRCFDLLAEGSGGSAPYTFLWEDGSLQSQRRVCLENAGTVLTVIASDANDVRSETHVIRLANAHDAGCPDPTPASDASVAAALCVENGSFEGTPAVNFGGEGEFDAEPWDVCTNPVVTNTPDIGNESVAVGTTVPPPVHGETYMALGEGEQVSQALCEEIPVGAELHFELDLSRVDIGDVPLPESVFLEIYGGLSVDCIQRQLLWASPGLDTGWQRFCVTLRPQFFMNQLTLRASSDMTSLSPAYLLVDNLQPVDSCP